MKLFKNTLYVVAFLVLFGNILPERFHIANAATPDLRGTYSGTGTQTWWNCTDSISNGTYQTRVLLTIDTQNGNRFTGTAVETSQRFGLTGKNNVSLTGTVDSQSQFSGSFSSSLYIENTFDSSAKGNFSGKLDGNKLTARAKGKDVVGDTCSGSGTWDVTREGPVVTLNLSRFDRVPIYNKKTPNDQSVVVTLSPDSLPLGTFVTLKLITKSGTTGKAIFDNGQDTMSVMKSTTVKIRGKINSNEKDNIKLTARLNGGKLLDEVAFSVRTWPKNFRRSSYQCNPMSNGVLPFVYTWDSESGETEDLNGNIIGEWVDYPGNNLDLKYKVKSPPYNKCFIKDPYVEGKIIGTNIFTELPDDQRIPCDTGNPGEEFYEYETLNIFDTPVSDYFVAIQYYWFHDPIFMDIPFNWNNTSSYKKLMGSIAISRFVYKDNGVWKYQIEKHGCIGEIAIPQLNNFSDIVGAMKLLLLRFQSQ